MIWQIVLLAAAAATEPSAATTLATGPVAASVVAPATVAVSPVTAPAALAAIPPAPAVDPPTLTITATRSPDDPFGVAPHVSVVGPAELQRQPLDQTPDLLDGEPGVLVQKTNYGGGSPFVRGLTGKQVLLLVDGIRMNNSLYRFGPHQYLNTVDPYTLERVEVVRGPGSVLHGTDAIGGVVQLITRDPERYSDERAFGPGAAVGAASADRSLRGRVQLEGEHEASQTAVRAGGSSRVFQDVWGGGGVDRQIHTGYRELSADLKVRQPLPGPLELVVAQQALRQFDVPKTSEMTLDGKLKYNYEPQLRALSYAQLRGRAMGALLADELTASLSFQFHGEGEQVQRSAAERETHERNDAHTWGTFLHLVKWLPGQHQLGYGAEFYSDRIDSRKVELLPGGGQQHVRPAFPDGARYHMLGVYVHDAWRAHRHVRLFGGARYSRFLARGDLQDPATGNDVHLELDADDFTGSVGFVLGPAHMPNLVGQLAKGFRAPNMEDFFGKVDFATEIPNTDLDPETAYDVEGGLRLRRPQFQGQLFYFRSELRDMIGRADVSADVDGDGVSETVATRRNIGRARIQGAEAALAGQPTTWLDLRATAAYTLGDELIDGGPDQPLRRMPPLLGGAAVRYGHSAGHFVLAELAWADRQDRLSPGDVDDARIPSGGTPGYGIVHVRAGWSFAARGLLKFGVENVGDLRYKTHGSGVYGPGRNVYLEYAVGL